MERPRDPPQNTRCASFLPFNAISFASSSRYLKLDLENTPTRSALPFLTRGGKVIDPEGSLTRALSYSLRP